MYLLRNFYIVKFLISVLFSKMKIYIKVTIGADANYPYSHHTYCAFII